MAPRFTTRTVRLLESPQACPSCGWSMRVSLTEPGVVYCDRLECADVGVMRKEQ
jgi:hypothetical protein